MSDLLKTALVAILKGRGILIFYAFVKVPLCLEKRSRVYINC